MKHLYILSQSIIIKYVKHTKQWHRNWLTFSLADTLFIDSILYSVTSVLYQNSDYLYNLKIYNVQSMIFLSQYRYT